MRHDRIRQQSTDTENSTDRSPPPGAPLRPDGGEDAPPGHELVGRYGTTDRALARDHLPDAIEALAIATDLRTDADGELVTASVEVDLRATPGRHITTTVGFSVHRDDGESIAYPVGIEHAFPGGRGEIDCWHLAALPPAARHLRETTAIDRVVSPTDYLQALLIDVGAREADA